MKSNCNCGADRTGPSAEAHLSTCPESEVESPASSGTALDPELQPDFCVCDYRPRRKCSVHPEAAVSASPAAPLKDGEPCSHPGCLAHTSHPCEGCGRINGKGTINVSYGIRVASPAASTTPEEREEFDKCQHNETGYLAGIEYCLSCGARREWKWVVRGATQGDAPRVNEHLSTWDEKRRLWVCVCGHLSKNAAYAFVHGPITSEYDRKGDAPRHRTWTELKAELDAQGDAPLSDSPLTPTGEQRVSDYRSGYSCGYSDAKNGTRMRDKDAACLFLGITGVPDIAEPDVTQGDAPAQRQDVFRNLPKSHGGSGEGGA